MPGPEAGFSSASIQPQMVLPVQLGNEAPQSPTLAEVPLEMSPEHDPCDVDDVWELSWWFK